MQSDCTTVNSAFSLLWMEQTVSLFTISIKASVLAVVYVLFFSRPYGTNGFCPFIMTGTNVPAYYHTAPPGRIGISDLFQNI